MPNAVKDGFERISNARPRRSQRPAVRVSLEIKLLERGRTVGLRGCALGEGSCSSLRFAIDEDPYSNGISTGGRGRSTGFERNCSTRARENISTIAQR